jgi:putative toxin-antitoxin system antitoxin component (TIGR02293 family)
MGKSVSNILGLRQEPASALEMALAIQKGLPAFTLTRICQQLAMDERQMAAILGIPVATVRRLRGAPQRRLSPAISDRVYRVADLFLLAAEVLEDEGAARHWLLSPQPGLGNRVPCDLMGNEASAREVEDLLLRVEHGVLS